MEIKVSKLVEVNEIVKIDFPYYAESSAFIYKAISENEVIKVEKNKGIELMNKISNHLIESNKTSVLIFEMELKKVLTLINKANGI